MSKAPRRIHVSSLNQMPEVAKNHPISHLVSVLSREQIAERPTSIEADAHLRLSFNDVSEKISGFDLAEENDITRLIGFAQNWYETGEKDLLVHCWLGISRAPACCYIMACALNPQQDEMVLAKALRAASPFATPNPYLVELADQALNRNGRMIKAIQSLGRGDDYQEMNFSLELA